MTNSVTLTKPRARRIAADEAHSWARNLRLRNPYAKLLLCMITQYVQGDGTCFVGIKALADDCELAPETIRRRLGWLEGVGAITRMPQWVDENGRRNSDGRGRRTTDEIRLMFDSDETIIEERAAGHVEANGDGEGDDGEHSPAAVTLHAGRGSNVAEATDGGVNDSTSSGSKNLPGDSISPLVTPSLRTGAESSEPEPEGNPPTPLRGEGQTDLDREGETRAWPHAETWAKFEAAWREPVLHQQLCRQIWSAFTDAERDMAIKVARGYWNWRSSQKRPPNVCNAQKILREIDAWPRFAELAGPDPALRTFIAEGTRDFDAYAVLTKIGGWQLPPSQVDPEKGVRGFWRSRPPPPDLLGLAAFAAVPIERWVAPAENSPSFFAWRRAIDDWTGRKPNEMRVPANFPPRKDGSINPSDMPLATAEDLNQFGKTG